MPPVERDRPRRVLIVEDDGGVARMLRFSLEQAGLETIEAASGTEALDVLEQQSPDAVTLDLQLADGKGGAVLDRLRQLDETATGSPAWVVTSALNRQEVAARCGPVEGRFLSKPFSPWDLIAMLEELLLEREVAKDGKAVAKPESDS
jgi:CheY-like chemotaxis protein